MATGCWCIATQPVMPWPNGRSSSIHQVGMRIFRGPQHQLLALPAHTQNRNRTSRRWRQNQLPAQHGMKRIGGCHAAADLMQKLDVQTSSALEPSSVITPHPNYFILQLLSCAATVNLNHIAVPAQTVAVTGGERFPRRNFSPLTAFLASAVTASRLKTEYSYVHPSASAGKCLFSGPKLRTSAGA